MSSSQVLRLPSPPLARVRCSRSSDGSETDDPEIIGPESIGRDSAVSDGPQGVLELPYDLVRRQEVADSGELADCVETELLQECRCRAVENRLTRAWSLPDGGDVAPRLEQPDNPVDVHSTDRSYLCP